MNANHVSSTLIGEDDLSNIGTESHFELPWYVSVERRITIAIIEPTYLTGLSLSV